MTRSCSDGGEEFWDASLVQMGRDEGPWPGVCACASQMMEDLG